MLEAAWLTALATAATLLGGLTVWFVRHLWRVLRRVIRFLDDFFGEPAHEGLPPKPGVMARLGSVEDLVQKIATEMSTNHGTSLRDVVQQTAADVQNLKDNQDELGGQMIKLRESIGRGNRQ